jgi:anthranilate synthase component 2
MTSLGGSTVRLLMVDNFDSFTYNLVQYLRELGAEVVVVRNDTDKALPELLNTVDGLVVSPGPCTPIQAGRSIEALRMASGEHGPRRPALGVCLGHQALAEAFGGRVVRASIPMHGKTSPIWHDGTPPFVGIPSPLEVMRYHSLVVSDDGLPQVLRVTARTTDGTIMGLAHRDLPLYGVQFHPESIMTGEGKAILTSFLNVVQTTANAQRRAASVVA